MITLYNKFYQLFAVVMLMIGMPMTIMAQEADESRNIRIMFIDHDESLESAKIIRYMRQMRREQKELGHAMIIYVPNGENPFISMTGIRDISDKGYDSDAAFDKICEALNQPSHDKLPWADRKNIVDMFTKYNIIDDRNNLNFSNVRMEFYVTQEFWNLGYHETIIAPIFMALDVESLLKKPFNFDVLYDPEHELQYDKENAFGLKNYNNINKTISIDEYTF